jgi:GTPase
VGAPAAAGGVGLRGPGETQLEVDRREIRKRISNLRAELEKVRAHRMRYRSQRQRSQIPIVALVGYTNAGKSTLLNRLAKADVFVANQLFATLDPTTRRVELPNGHGRCSPTRWFYSKAADPAGGRLPRHAGRNRRGRPAAARGRCLASQCPEQIKAVELTLSEIDAGHIPVILVMNKADRLPDPELAVEMASDSPGVVTTISALTGTGISNMLAEIEEELYETYVPVAVRLPFQEGQLISLFHDQGQVEHTRAQPRRCGDRRQPARSPAGALPAFVLVGSRKTIRKRNRDLPDSG